MDATKTFIVEHLDKKSNAILGFIILQSIFLADKLSSEEFVQKVRGIKGLYTYIFIGHSLILIFAVIFLLMIDSRVSNRLDPDDKKAIQPHFTLAVKITLCILFGLIPILVLAGRLDL